MATRSPEPPADGAMRSPGEPAIEIADLVEESVAVFGLDLRIRAWNAEAERLYGWTRDEVIGGIFQSFVHCSPSEPLVKILAEVRETGTWRGEFLRRTKRGDNVAVRAKWSLREMAAARHAISSKRAATSPSSSRKRRR